MKAVPKIVQPSGKSPNTTDVAHGAVYLASDEARGGTDLMLPIDSGLFLLRQWSR
jgi:hypothetical protein